MKLCVLTLCGPSPLSVFLLGMYGRYIGQDDMLKQWPDWRETTRCQLQRVASGVKQPGLESQLGHLASGLLATPLGQG